MAENKPITQRILQQEAKGGGDKAVVAKANLQVPSLNLNANSAKDVETAKAVTASTSSGSGN